MSLTLSNTEKASISVAYDPGDGSAVQQLGSNFHFNFSTTAATLQSTPTGLFVVGVTPTPAGNPCILHVSTLDNATSTDIPVTVTGTAPSLVVTLGAPVPK